MTRWLWLSLLVILLDQSTKQLAESTLTLYESVSVLPFFDLTLLYNKGAAFSFLSDQGGWQRWFFIVLAIVVCIVLVGWLWRLKRDELWVAVALSLIIGGAIGNVIDRILFGQVIDFLHFHYQQHYFPAFNVADSAITVGVIIMLYDALVLAKRRE
ncbi:MAG: signal peptidase II [Candidatus Thiodiazotropha sp. (ex Lucina aurantia)]|uniref:Lipoprotein signal peptidase n=2 Tax=Candidatus Thiodiazotropha TaxID=1913444 RepID=A0A7Z0VLG4_9GAMM|nr:signal peptidase II [Candidatus Thiodiazotropha endolucinida]MBT3010507.1 lipoprotein signal peptidase [Candidatus Thiodiazotropha sp. (ex Lucina pensylvanica)]MBT3016220.1 lipoprotein signal peptidase [Candidatus Thiodiazotropha taylori]MBT3040191.1 lipoprotein signal peptidase [Candidatus Thiodiazotropha sp. (ex Codakia orbicularis)]MBV2102216.1 signal peptidase II [Candidatus Thiodiazotropha sp. (ex Lucina aurantia)]MBT3022187.1 lipoprotein signal peptidase [Candidatus Thiodiazotropha ta